MSFRNHVMSAHARQTFSRAYTSFAQLAAAMLLVAWPLASTSAAPTITPGPKLIGSGATGLTQQGSSVALSADGATLIVGGPGDGTVGASWIFTRTGSGWMQQGPKLVGTGVVGPLAAQGTSVGISSDGNTAIVGGYADDLSSDSVGASWIFVRTGSLWSQEGPKLVGTGAIGLAKQGVSVAISGDGNTAIIGGNADDGGIGAAWIFVRSGSTWTRQAKLVGTGAIGPASQGLAVGLSADGNTAIVGGYNDAGETGAGWVFTRSGTTWAQDGLKLIGSGAVGFAAQGASVAISGDGGTILLGGIGDNFSVGATWVFTKVGGVWVQQGGKLVGTGAVGSSFQGTSTRLSATGDRAVVGGPIDNGQTGAIWIFDRQGSLWSQVGGKLVGAGAIGASNQGQSVAISADGSTIAEGGPFDNLFIGATWSFDVATPVPALSPLSIALLAFALAIAGMAARRSA